MKKISCLFFVLLLIILNIAPVFSAEEEYYPIEENLQIPEKKGGLLLEAKSLGEVGYSSFTPLGNESVNTSALMPIEEYLEEQLLLHKTKIVVTSYYMRTDDFEMLYYDLIHKNPELLVYSTYDYNYSGDIITAIYPLYVTNSQAEDVVARNLMNTKIDEYIAYAEDCPDLIGKLLLIHDKLVEDITYDHASIAAGTWDSHHAYKLFSQNTAVCQGMSQALHMIAKELGIEGEFISGSPEMNHIWNCFKIDGKWYQLDMTWNDIDDATTSYHAFFLLSDAKMAESHGAKSTWYTFSGIMPTCSDTTYESRHFFNLPSSMTVKYTDGAYNFPYTQEFSDGSSANMDFKSTTLYQGPIIAFVPTEENLSGNTWIFFSESVSNIGYLYACHENDTFIGTQLDTNISYPRTFVRFPHARSRTSQKISHIFWDLNTMTPLSKKVTIN